MADLPPDTRAFVAAWATIERAGLRTGDLAALLLISGSSLRRMRTGRKPVPPKVAIWVIQMADFLTVNPVPRMESRYGRQQAAPGAR